MPRCNRGFVHFLHFVTLRRTLSGSTYGRGPAGREGGIAGLERIGGLAADSRRPRREGDRVRRRQGDNEGDSPFGCPLTRAASTARLRQERQDRRLRLRRSVAGRSIGDGL